MDDRVVRMLDRVDDARRRQVFVVGDDNDRARPDRGTWRADRQMATTW